MGMEEEGYLAPGPSRDSGGVGAPRAMAAIHGGVCGGAGHQHVRQLVPRLHPQRLELVRFTSHGAVVGAHPNPSGCGHASYPDHQWAFPQSAPVNTVVLRLSSRLSVPFPRPRLPRLPHFALAKRDRRYWCTARE